MIARSPAWIVVVGAALVSTSGALGTAGTALIGIDNAIRATIDLKAMAAKVFPPPKPKFVKIKPVVIPHMPVKAPRK